MFFSCLGPGSLGAEAEMKIHEWVVYYRSNSRSWRKQEGDKRGKRKKPHKAMISDGVPASLSILGEL